MYRDFESAKEYYEKYDIIPDDSIETSEFKDLMEFIYIGIQPKKKMVATLSEEEYLINQ